MERCEIHTVATVKNVRGLQGAGKSHGAIHKREDCNNQISAKIPYAHFAKSERQPRRRVQKSITEPTPPLDAASQGRIRRSATRQRCASRSSLRHAKSSSTSSM